MNRQETNQLSFGPMEDRLYDGLQADMFRITATSEAISYLKTKFGLITKVVYRTFEISPTELMVVPNPEKDVDAVRLLVITYLVEWYLEHHLFPGLTSVTPEYLILQLNLLPGEAYVVAKLVNNNE